MSQAQPGPITQFIERHYMHFNSAALKDAARDYKKHIEQGGKMLMTLAGAMSTAELGKSLAEMIRQGKVHAISCTGANLEEDMYNLVAHEFYERIPKYRDLTADDEEKILKRRLNRVTDTCIPEEEAIKRFEPFITAEWKKADQEGRRHFPYEYFYMLIRSGVLKNSYQIDPKDSWLVAACEKNLPIWTPGWEDSTVGNWFAAKAGDGTLKNGVSAIKAGPETFMSLVKWYKETFPETPKGVGFFQIGGGIAGDFAICSVPHILQDLREECPTWAYFCQISDSTTSYGSYSGAVPNEKITWNKLRAATPKHVIESDATIVAPLMFAYIMEW